MADVRKELSSDCSDSVSFKYLSFYMRKEVAQKKICNTKNLVRLPHPQESERRNGLRTEFCEKDTASFGKQYF